MDQASFDSAKDLGAVLAKARRFRTSLLALNSQVEMEWYRKLANQNFQVDDRTTKQRVTQLPGLLRMAFGEAVLAAANHFFFFDLWQQVGDGAEDELRRNAIDYAHFFADVVPIQLFNFKMMLDSPEAERAFRMHDRIQHVFDNYFPKITDARHAVAHQHDRNLAARTFRGERILFEVAVNDEAFAPNGKTYRDAHGGKFEFKFELQRLEAFWSDYKKHLENECA